MTYCKTAASIIFLFIGVYWKFLAGPEPETSKGASILWSFPLVIILFGNFLIYVATLVEIECYFATNFDPEKETLELVSLSITSSSLLFIPGLILWERMTGLVSDLESLDTKNGRIVFRWVVAAIVELRLLGLGFWAIMGVWTAWNEVWRKLHSVWRDVKHNQVHDL
jgi:hypothetical protein